MKEEEQKQALKRLASYSKDMREGRIDISECVQLSTYDSLEDEVKAKDSLDFTPLRKKIEAKFGPGRKNRVKASIGVTSSVRKKRKKK